MKKDITAVFTLTKEEIKEAFSEKFVKKLKENNMSFNFDPGAIKIEVKDDHLNISLTIKEEKEI